MYDLAFFVVVAAFIFISVNLCITNSGRSPAGKYAAWRIRLPHHYALQVKAGGAC